MLPAVTLVLAAVVFAAGCATTPVTTTATPIGAPGTLERCDGANPGGQGGSESPIPGGSAESPSETHRYCLRLTLSRNEGWEQLVQVGVLSDRPSDPLRDRTVLVYHPGGPGLAVVPTMMADPPPVDLARYVVLAWDGATSSDGPGACGVDSMAFIMDRRPADLAGLATRTAAECSGGFGGANDIGAWAAAEELEAIRQALRVERFDLLTHSYGSAIAEAYLSMHPDRVRRAVLDAPIGLQVPWLARVDAVAPVLQDGADRLARSCSTSSCVAVLRDVPQDQSYEALREAVLAKRPMVGSGNVTLTPVMLDQTTTLALHSADYWRGYATAIDEALAGDGTSLWRIAERLYLDLDRQVFYRSMCADIDRPSVPEEFVVGHDPLLFSYTSEFAPCFGFPRGIPRATAPAPSMKPDVLVVASRQDVRAPSALVASSPFLQSVGSLCTTNVAGHTSARDPAVRDIVTAFLESGGAESHAARCN